MTRGSGSRCGALAGLTFLLCLHAYGDEGWRDATRAQLRDDSYVLVEESTSIRLYVLSETVDAAAPEPVLRPPSGSVDAALAMIHSADHRSRVRGLTLLAGVEDAPARDAALALLHDPVDAVREEAYILLLEHPDVDRPSIVALGNADPSPRVREAVADALNDAAGD